MHRIRIVCSTKPLWIPVIGNNERNLYCGITRFSVLVTPSFTLQPQTVRTIYNSVPNCTAAASQSMPSLFSRILSKIGVPDAGKYKRRLVGYLLFEDIVKNVKYSHFFEDFKMPDTFCSWFVITELHVWMLMIRYMAEGKNGQDMRNHIVEAMWNDVNERKSKLGKANVVALKKQVAELSQQFNAAIIGYDEGIMSDDKVLAGALWRRILQCESSNPEFVEQLVLYVRKQMNELDKLPKEDIMQIKKISWLDHRNL